ncbi:UDP-N-acetyl-D-mannosamine dehydrogenase [Boudabousia liubingyangii]|uniref:UDP-N-acetyl-D-mannosamine dehydrogenase n=1 Tax=Boudabousia liubingyangii TaxID=1921764 RepID=A0A1Q5PPF9_9ACTO|nr:UDP-N-acetyl-D-mannosamine dehydrogenase [Boudabousia liubingyangii]OKL49488.1 UDP-N-acetyl-D-mannosamine dehydrogenase [Boudabousia liubingyangii]
MIVKQNFSESKKQLCVIGLGYIGLPTAVVFAQNGWQVKGVDVSDRTIEYVSRGELPFVEKGLKGALKTVVDAGMLTVQKDTPKADVYIVSVPTPFKDTQTHAPDLSYIEAATKGIIPQLSGDELVVLESTSPPGTTRFMADLVMSARPDLSLDGSDNRPIVHFAHAPERVLPGQIMVEMTENDRIVGGLTPEATEKAREIYATFCQGAILTTDAKTAELAKLTENSFRDVNIAFANELSLICDQLDINVWELIKLANRHPRVNILQPGPGVGGHCIAVDPWFIVASDPDNSNLIRTAREVNDSKPDFVLEKVFRTLTSQNQDRVTVLGLAFKPNIDDLRESPAMRITERLAASPAVREVIVAEPNINELPEVLAKTGKVRLAPIREAISESEVVVQLVDHAQFKGLTLADLSGKTFINTRGSGFVA